MSARDERVAFLCLGTMGYPMAGHLARAGYRVRVYNRSPARASAWQEEFCSPEEASESVAATPAQAVAGAEMVFVCAGNDADLRAVLLGPEGALAAVQAGARLVDHTTVSPGLARELFRAAEQRDVAFLDAPISGGQAGAENAALTIMIGGDEQVYRRAIPWLDCYAKSHLYMGPAGSGQLTKAVNQICIAGLLQALSEGLNFAEKAGLDAHKVVEVISKGAAQSWQMDNRAETMLDRKFDFGFAVDWMRKDLAIALEEANRIAARVPITALVDQLYADVQARGGGRHDTSSLFRLLE